MTSSVVLLETALLGLAILDGMLALVVFLRPGFFDRVFFERLTVDDTDHLYRHGGLWLTFSLIQFVAYWFWVTDPFLLLVVVGVRLSEWCADWILLALRPDITPLGSILFFVSSPFTIAFGLYFFRAYQNVLTTATPGYIVPWIRPDGAILSVLIFGLVLLDVVLGLIVLRYPRFWKKLTQGSSSGSPGGWLTRTGGVWLGFAVLQAVVFTVWPQYPEALLVLAGLRSTEVLADWIFLACARHVTGFGRFFLLIAPPVNGVLALVFYQGYIVATQ